MDYMGYQYPYQPMNNMFRPSMSSMSSMNGFIKVNGIDGAKAYQMPPNSSVPLFDVNEDVFYMKTTDGAGFPTIRRFVFQEQQEAPQQHVDYVTRQELEELKGMINNAQQSVQQPAGSIPTDVLQQQYPNAIPGSTATAQSNVVDSNGQTNA